jgi:hypothetical protein
MAPLSPFSVKERVTRDDTFQRSRRNYFGNIFAKNITTVLQWKKKNLFPLQKITGFISCFQKPPPPAAEQDGSSRRKRAFLFNAASDRVKQAATYGGGI